MPLTPFQKRKIDRMFAALDLDGDGFIERSDYTDRVERVSRARRWRRDSPEYERNRHAALEHWDGLCEIADVDADGKVSRDEFQRYAEIFLDDRDAIRSYAHGDAQLLFDAMDTDSDDRVSAAEYRDYLAACGIDTAMADDFFDYADLDRDGFITRAELAHAVQEFLLSENPEAAGNYLFGALDPG